MNWKKYICFHVVLACKRFACQLIRNYQTILPSKLQLPVIGFGSGLLSHMMHCGVSSENVDEIKVLILVFSGVLNLRKFYRIKAHCEHSYSVRHTLPLLM